MNLGAFSVSLAVKNLEASRAFYQSLGFAVFHGDAEEGWLILQNGTAVIGLFEGMFDRNIVTFNPGWNQGGREVDPFTDIRELQRCLRDSGIAFEQQADESTTGPASFTLTDPDGNSVLVDQHR